MITARWRKVLRDLWANRARTALVVAAVAIGVFGAGSVLSAYTILTREMAASYMATQPASAILTLPNVQEADLETARAYAGVTDAQTRGMARVRIKNGANAWRVIDLFVVSDFEDVRISQVRPDTGRPVPGADEIVIERASIPILTSQLGDAVVINANGAERSLAFVGTVHDPGKAPAWMDGLAYGFITPETAKGLGIAPANTILLEVEDAGTTAEVSAVAYGVRHALAARGTPVARVQVMTPGEHPDASQMKTLMFILQSFGVIVLVLSCALVAALLNSLMARQVREIGAMKAIGATSAQVAGIYAATVLALGVMATSMGIPLAVAGGRAYAAFATQILNIEIADWSIPAWVFGAEAGIGILAPLLAATYPILRGARVSVREAVTDTGVSAGSRVTRAIESLAARVRGLGRPTLLSLRNTVRRPGRLALSVAMLAVGGAGFMGAMSAGASWQATVDATWQRWGSDLDIVLAAPLSADEVREAIDDVPGVKRVELWTRAQGVVSRPDDTDGDALTLFGAPSASSIYSPKLRAGRWLMDSDTDAMVITHRLAEDEGLSVGNRLTARLADGTETAWHVVGVAEEIAPAQGYVRRASLDSVTEANGGANLIRVTASDRSGESVAEVSEGLEAALDEVNVPVAVAATITQRRDSLIAHIMVFVSLLSIISALIVAVGGLGLASTMSVNVMERMREIGVMQALGATTHQLTRIILVEGALVGALSWVLGLALSLPLSRLIGEVGGEIFVKAPLVRAFSVQGSIIWLVVVLVVGALASLGPILSASRRAIQETLAYQ